MPVVHSSASALSTAGVFSGHGPSSNVSTTSLSRRKSSCLKCSKPNPGPPVVSISTTRLMPSASGLAQVLLAGAGAGRGVACDHAAPVIAIENALATIRAAVLRIVAPFDVQAAPKIRHVADLRR